MYAVFRAFFTAPVATIHLLPVAADATIRGRLPLVHKLYDARIRGVHLEESTNKTCTFRSVAEGVPTPSHLKSRFVFIHKQKHGLLALVYCKN